MRKSALDFALDALRGLAADDQWITIRPNGPDATGRPALIDESGTIKAGMGGKFNGRSIDDVPRGKNPHPVKEEKYQARQKRMAEKEAAGLKSQHQPPPAPQQPSQQAGGGGSTTASGGRYSTLRPQELANLMQTGTQGAKTKAEAYAIAKQNADVIFADVPAVRAELEQKKQAQEQAYKLFKEHKIDSLEFQRYLDDYNDFERKTKGYLEGERQFRAGYEKVRGMVEGQNIQLPPTPPVLGSNLPKSNTYTGTLPAGQSKLRKAYKVDKETDKAYGVKVNGVMQWIPKSRSTVHEGELVGMEGWLWKKTGIGTDSALAADSRFLALDRNSVRTVDENGYLHVKSSHISKATVNPYYGKEIPGWREEGLEPDKIYYGFRAPGELEKSVPTWAGLPLHIEHHIDSAEDPQKLTRVGTVGTEIVWNDPYLDAPLTIWDQHAIDGIEDDSFRELSCAYRYEPDFSPGEWHGKKYDFVMRNIRGNHVALVEEGRAGSDVLVADAKPAALESHKKGGLMNKFLEWFRGAQDGEPEQPEQIDFVEAVLKAHKRDPVTGAERDVVEDEGKAAELRVLWNQLKDKLPPEDVKSLVEAIGALSAAEAKGDEEPMNEEEKKNVYGDAMKAAGCDAEDPEETRAFAEGVKYGEELEKNPAEREKLDREHESEGMRNAMDKCGVDAESPAEVKAFAEGVKYGEEKAKAEDAEPEKKDENPAEVGTDEDKNAMIEKILAAVPDLTEEQKKKIQDTLADLAYEPATGDEDLDKKVEGAADRALKKHRFLGATDAARIRAQATADAMERIRGISEAVRKVRPLVGEMDAMSFDSANEVYAHTLKQLGKDPARYDRKAWRGMVDMLLDGKAAMASDASMARDSKPVPDSGPFSHLKRINLSE